MNILLVDDQKIFLKSFAHLVGQHIPDSIISQAHSGKSAIAILDDVKPDVVLLDINMPDMNGLEVAEYLNKNYPHIKIVMLTNVDGEAMILNLAKIVDGFLLKDIEDIELKKCVSTVMSGGKYFCKDAQEIIYNNMNAMGKTPYIHLELRELELIKLLANGWTSKEIANEWNVNEKTVNNYREVLIKRTKTKNAVGLVAYAYNNGLMD
ncbi:MAG TPA: response regulator transcription factor [Cyclobacteriaceae bacterium]